MKKDIICDAKVNWVTVNFFSVYDHTIKKHILIEKIPHCAKICHFH